MLASHGWGDNQANVLCRVVGSISVTHVGRREGVGSGGAGTGIERLQPPGQERRPHGATQ